MNNTYFQVQITCYDALTSELLTIDFTDGYHIYRDSTTFAYDITLARANLCTNKNQRYSLKVKEPPVAHDSCSSTKFIFSTPVLSSVPPLKRPRVRISNARAQRLQIYETHNTPKLYACYTKYSAPGQSSIPEVLAPLGSSFELALGVFKQFYKLKTHKEWDDRLIKAYMGEEAFVYTPPKEGESKGQVLSFEVL